MLIECDQIGFIFQQFLLLFIHFFYWCCSALIPLVKKVNNSRYVIIQWTFQPHPCISTWIGEYLQNLFKSILLNSLKENGIKGFLLPSTNINKSSWKIDLYFGWYRISFGKSGGGIYRHIALWQSFEWSRCVWKFIWWTK